MRATGTRRVSAVLWVVLGACLAAAGCHTCPPSGGVCCPSAGDGVPRELNKVSLPPYIIETPDILTIDAVRVVPKPPLRLQPLDSVIVVARNVLPQEPINGLYPVEPEGVINFGPTYGSVPVVGLTIEQARAAVEKQLKAGGYEAAVVQMTLGQSRALQQIRGEHLVRPDGTVSLGTYGSVYVSGLTLDQAKAAVEQHLGQYLLNPEVAVDVFAYNSKSYYIVTSGGGYGEQVYSFPHTGNETVLDAMAKVYGLPAVASLHRIWVARPAPAEADCYQVLPVDWEAMTRGGATATNYQLLPGDRIFVDANPLVTADTFLARVFQPIERVFGITLLGTGVVQSFRTSGTGNGNGTGGIGGF